MQVYDEHGDPIPDEVIPKTEADKQAAEAADKARQEAEEAAQVKLSEKDTELEKLREQERNFKELRGGKAKTEEEKQEAEAKLAEVQQSIQKVQEEQNAIREGQHTERRDSVINRLAGGDKELADKIRVIYDTQVTGDNTTKDGVEARALNAYILATKSAPPDGVLNGPAISGAGGNAGGGSEPTINGVNKQEVIDLGRRFGISEEAINKNWNKNILYSNSNE